MGGKKKSKKDIVPVIDEFSIPDLITMMKTLRSIINNYKLTRGEFEPPPSLNRTRVEHLKRINQKIMDKLRGSGKI